MRYNSFLLTTIVAATFGTSVAAQSTAVSRDSILSGSLAVMQLRPQGVFGQHIGTGYGITGALLFRVDRAGILSIRADIGGLQYGNETKRTPISDEIGGRILVDVNTTNYVVPMSIGPQLTWPSGWVRPYVTAGVGGVAFFTESSVGGRSDHSTFASTVNQSDFNPLWTASSGIYVRVHEGRVPVMLDLGVQYIDGGRARYLAPGSIIDLPGGGIRITPIESRTQMLMVRVGARIGR